MELAERFWSHVDRTGDCWEWSANRLPSKYGLFNVRLGKSVLAHRVAYELAKEPIPDGMCVLHRCDNPPCVNPDHLFLGTDADNTRDRVQKGRAASGERNSQAKLTPALVMAIRRAAARGVTAAAMARAAGVSHETVRQ